MQDVGGSGLQILHWKKGRTNIKLGKHFAHPQKQNTTSGSKPGDLSAGLGGSHAARAKSLVLGSQRVTWLWWKYLRNFELQECVRLGRVGTRVMDRLSSVTSSVSVWDSHRCQPSCHHAAQTREEMELPI